MLYSRKRVRYRRDGYCWKKRKDGKTTREDHMKLKVQGIECIYGCYVHSAILPTFHRRCYWLLQVRLSFSVFLHKYLSNTLKSVIRSYKLYKCVLCTMHLYLVIKLACHNFFSDALCSRVSFTLVAALDTLHFIYISV